MQKKPSLSHPTKKLFSIPQNCGILYTLPLARPSGNVRLRRREIQRLRVAGAEESSPKMRKEALLCAEMMFGSRRLAEEKAGLRLFVPMKSERCSGWNG